MLSSRVPEEGRERVVREGEGPVWLKLCVLTHICRIPWEADLKFRMVVEAEGVKAEIKGPWTGKDNDKGRLKKNPLIPLGFRFKQDLYLFIW